MQACIGAGAGGGLLDKRAINPDYSDALLNVMASKTRIQE